MLANVLSAEVDEQERNPQPLELRVMGRSYPVQISATPEQLAAITDGKMRLRELQP
jgi:hypothetical protein